MLTQLLILAEADSLPGNATGVLWIAGLLAASGPVSALATLVGLFATRREVEALEKRLTDAQAKLDHYASEIHSMERRLNLASEERSVNLHERINEVLSELSRLSGRFDQSERHHDRPH